MHAIVSQFHAIKKKLKCKRRKLICLSVFFARPSCRPFICHLEDTHFNWIVSPFMHFVCVCSLCSRIIRKNLHISILALAQIRRTNSFDACSYIKIRNAFTFNAIWNADNKSENVGQNWIAFHLNGIRMRDRHSFWESFSGRRWWRRRLLLVIITKLSSAAQPIVIVFYLSFSTFITLTHTQPPIECVNKKSARW